MAPQAAAGGERGVAHQALVRLEARVCPDVSFEHSRGGEPSTALDTLVGSFSRVRPAVKKGWQLGINTL